MRQRSTSATATSWKLGCLANDMMSDIACPEAPMLACRSMGVCAARAGSERNGAAAADAAMDCRKRRRETGGIDMRESVAPERQPAQTPVNRIAWRGHFKEPDAAD